METTAPERHTIGTRNKDAPFYDSPLTSVKPEVRDLLEGYSGIKSDDVLDRILQAREELWQVYPWPCIGEFRFLEVKIHEHPSYHKAVEEVRNGARYLDIGSCFGQDLRKLVSEGVPTDNLWVVEKEKGFLEASFKFFGDKDTPPAHFISGDIVDTGNGEVNALVGTVDIIHISMVLHVWDWNGQVVACKRLVELLKPKKGALILGRLVGRLEACVWRGPEGKDMYKHNVASFEQLWREVGDKTGTRWEVRAYFSGIFGCEGDTKDHWEDPPTRRLMFEVERL